MDIRKMYSNWLANELKTRKDNEAHYYLGEKYTVIFDDNIKHYEMDNNMIFVKDEKMLEKFYKEACIKIFSERLDKCSLLFNNIPKYSLRIRKMPGKH